MQHCTLCPPSFCFITDSKDQPADDAGLLYLRGYSLIIKHCLAASFYDSCKDMFQPHRGHNSLQGVSCQQEAGNASMHHVLKPSDVDCYLKTEN